MSIMDMFKSFTGAAPQQQQQAPAGTGMPGNIPPAAAGTNPTNPTVPATDASGAAVGTNSPVVAAPMAEFADLWKPSETNSNDSAAGILGNIDPAKVMEVAGKTDFSKVVTQDTMQKISAGGPEAMEAMMEAMNKMAQTVYGQAAIASSKIVEQASTKMEERFATKMQSEMRRNTVSENLRNENPIFNNPAVAPLISAMEQQFTVKYPQASAKEITEMAKNYISGIGSAFSPQTASQSESSVAAKDDWSKFLG